MSPLPRSPTAPAVPDPPDGQENLPSLQGPARSHPRPSPLPTAGPSELQVPTVLHLQPAPLSLRDSAGHPHPEQSPYSSLVPSTQLHRSSRAVLGAGGSQRRTTIPTARDGLALLFCSTDEFPSPSRGPTQAPLLPQALPDWDSEQSPSHPALGQHCPCAWPTVPGLLSVTLAPSQGRAQTSCPVRIQGMAER